jgi:site-specific recombinase XerD
MPLGADVRRRRCRGSARARHRGTRVSGTPLNPPTVDEIVAVMRQAQQARYGDRLNGLIVVLWRAGLRINEALALTETDLDQRRGSILVRHGKNDRRREVGMDAWAWSAFQPWLTERAKLPVGPLFCVIVGPTRGHAWSASAARLELHRVAIDAGVRRRFAPTSSAMPTLWSCCTRGSRCH